jgi:class 3 adenylate cyclase
MSSPHLTAIFEKHNRVASSQVVFADVSDYSLRRTKTQAEVIDSFMEVVKQAVLTIAADFVDFAQTNNFNFSADILRIPTGDGAAVIFPFEGLHDIHLSFAKEMLRLVHLRNEEQPCERFTTDGWCNCHGNFRLRIAVAAGKIVLFRDVNGNFNAAGKALNLAARVMALSDPGQILFTNDAYAQLIDMVDDPYLVDSFRQYKNVKVKHGSRIDVHQYIDKKLTYLNNEPPTQVSLLEKMDDVQKSMGFQFPFMSDAEGHKPDAAKMIQAMETLMNLSNMMRSSARPGEPFLDTTAQVTPNESTPKTRQ